MEVDSYEHGVPSWVDLGTSDPDRASAFYADLFGWDVVEGPPEAGGYRLAHLRGRSVAGIGPQTNPGPPVWTVYVNVTDAADVATKVAANGGQVILAPFDVMGQGHMGVFQDAAGAFFSVWQPAEHKGAGIVNEPGTFCWSELMTTDVPGAIAFYSAVFGWGYETHGEGANAYTEWQVNGRSIGGLMAKPPTLPPGVPPFWGVYFAVADTDATVARVVALGGSVMMPATDIEPGRFAVVADPLGAVFNVLALKEGM